MCFMTFPMLVFKWHTLQAPSTIFGMASREKKQPLKKTVGMNIRLERVRLGLTQEALAVQIGTDQAYVSQVERAMIAISLDMLERIASALRVSPVELMDQTLGRGRLA